MFFPTLTNTPCQVAATSHLVAGVLVLSTIAGFGGDVTCPASAVHMPFISVPSLSPSVAQMDRGGSRTHTPVLRNSATGFRLRCAGFRLGRNPCLSAISTTRSTSNPTRCHDMHNQRVAIIPMHLAGTSHTAKSPYRHHVEQWHTRNRCRG